jgi:putative intracellular protease/amidase
MKLVMPIPSRDFDPSEVAAAWRILCEAGHSMAFATPDGRRGTADPMMISGEGLDVWGWIPGLRKVRVFGLLLRAGREARAAYRRLERDEAFLHPRSYADLRSGDFDGLVLPGGHHAAGMRAYLESDILQRFVAEFFETEKPVAAICHGVVLAARSRSMRTGKSVLYGRKTTALTWQLERMGWQAGRILRFWEPNYYRTYVEGKDEPSGYCSVQAEVTRALAGAGDFLDVPRSDPDYVRKTGGMMRDSDADSRPAWVVRDGNYVSARWPGDVHSFGHTFARVLAERPVSV